jgi:hypothetical protein
MCLVVVFLQPVISNDVHQGKNTNDTNSSNSVPDMAVEPRINQSPSEFLTTPVATSTSISAPGTL